MDISCVQSKIRHCDVYFECIYGMIEPSVFVEYGEIQYFSEYPKHIKYLKQVESFSHLRYLHKK